MNRLKAVLIIPIVLGVLLVPFGLFVPKNLFTMFIFWFLLLPIAALYLPRLVSKSSNHLLDSLVGIIIFYGSMVFMIYDHYSSDFFQMMLWSCGVNLVVVTAITLMRNPRVVAH